MNMKFFLLFSVSIFLFSCGSGAEKSDKQKKISAAYTLYVESKSNQQISFTQLKSRGLEMISKYVFGMNFEHIDNDNIKVVMENNLDSGMYEKTKSDVFNVDYNGKTYFVEDVKFKYSSKIGTLNKHKKITVNSSYKANEFWDAYINLITDTIRKNTKPGNKGVVVPVGNLSVKLNNGFVVSSKFDIYIFAK